MDGWTLLVCLALEEATINEMLESSLAEGSLEVLFNSKLNMNQ